MARIERTKKALEDAGIQNIQVRPSDIIINDYTLEVDLLIEDKECALKVAENIKIPHDLRFIRKRNVLEENRLLLLGDDKYTFSKQIMQGYQEA